MRLEAIGKKLGLRGERDRGIKRPKDQKTISKQLTTEY